MVAGVYQQQRVAMYSQSSGSDGKVSDFLRSKYEKQAGKHWNLFYKQHQDKFFKNRHYLQEEFGELSPSSSERSLLEVGCGVGNTVFPLADLDPLLHIHCCDFSKEAVKLVKEHENYSDRINAFVCDVTEDDLLENVPEHSVDIVTLIFVISAVPPHKLAQSVANIAKTLKPGARVLVRDYAVGDLAEERLDQKSKSRKLDTNYYIRGDGTFVVYFTEVSLRDAFEGSGCFKCLDMKTCEKEIENRKQLVTMHRKWIQAVFEYTGNSESEDKKYEWQKDQSIETGNLFAEKRERHLEEVVIAEGIPPAKVLSVHRENIHSEPCTGVMLWDGTKALAKVVTGAPDQFKGKRVVELGCGCSPLCAMALSRVEVDRVVVTDGNPSALEMLRENFELNSSTFDASSVEIRKLAWDDKADVEECLGGSSHFDAVIASDVLYIEKAIPPLFHAAGKLLGSGKASNGFFLICYTPRRAIENKAIEAAKAANLKLMDTPQAFQKPFEAQDLKNSMRMMVFGF